MPFNGLSSGKLFLLKGATLQRSLDQLAAEDRRRKSEFERTY